MNYLHKRLIAGFAFLSFITLLSSCSDTNTLIKNGKDREKSEQNVCAPTQGKLLVFSKTAGFRHKSIETGITALQKLGCNYGLAVDASEDATLFTAENLKQYATITFLNTTQDILNTEQQDAFKGYIQAGGGFLGIHAATDTEYKWPWYNKLVGAYFEGHPKQQTGKLNIIEHNHSSTELLPSTWNKFDEWYNFKDINADINVLIEIDETTYEGGTNGEHHPISWYHDFDGGRSFYTAMGHTNDSYNNQKFIDHLVGALKYTTNLPLKPHLGMPDETRFVRDVLDSNLSEPMELDELPNEGILFIERKGLLKLYDFKTKKVETIDNKEVFYKNEDGLLGLAVDPNYIENNWIYLFYSVQGEEAIQHVSRFKLVNRKIDLASEKVLLTIPVIRECCHSGGSLEFDKAGNLYIGIGDNTNPFKSDGFAPIDERSGRALYDAQRSAANTNSFKGKILRIKPEDDGTYSIPAGNLFPKGTPKTKPEIYLMGLRNPFRYSIDSENNYVYWGDVGPDAGKNDAKRGPAGMGEFNQAIKPSNWGWPYTRGNGQRYIDFDFETEKSGEAFNPQNLVNNSPNNTGLNKLPAAQESMMWYGYDESEAFPWLGKGGVNPMAGPVFHLNDFSETTKSFPTYFEDKLFVYEWMRDWVYVIAMDDNKNFLRAEQFMPNSVFSKPMDMLFASDGNLYVLEYGAKWFVQNEDARLNRISYVSGNRKPVANINANKLTGSAPLTVTLSGKESIDYDQDTLTYEWRINGILLPSSKTETDYTFDTNGEHIVELTVTDDAGLKATKNLTILVGNTAPEITFTTTPNSTVYSNDGKVSYEVLVIDEQDGSSANGSISSDNIKVSFNYVSAQALAAEKALGHQKDTTPKGKQLIDGSDCRACHGVSERVNGPSYQEIAATYSTKDMSYLVNKVIDGGSGVWGESPMSAHPQLEVDDVNTIVKYILSLDPNSKENKGLPLSGDIIFNKHQDKGAGGQYILKATYQDKGINNNESTRFTTTNQLIFTAEK